MPIINSGYMDPGIALSLLPGKSYAQARADKQADLQYTMALTDMYHQKLQEKQAYEAKMKQTFADLKSMPIQQQDQQRINLLVDQLRNGLSKKILEKYDGDIRKYMMYEGESDLQDLTSQILNNDITQKALSNKYAYGVYSKDMADGKDYTMPVSYTLVDGTKVENVPFSQALQDFNNYKTAELPYNGAFKMPKGAMEFFNSNFHPDPQNRYGVKYKDEKTGQEYLSAPQVTPQEYYDYLTNNKENPITAEQAKVLLQDLYPKIAPSLKWKTDDLFKYELDKNKVASDNWYKSQSIALQKERNQIAKKANDIKAAGVGAMLGTQTYTDVLDTQLWKPSKIGIDFKSTLGQGDKLLSTAGVQKGGSVMKVVSTKDFKTERDLSDVPTTLKEVDESKVYRLPDGRMAFKGKVSLKELDAEKKGAWIDGGYLWPDKRSDKFNSEKKGSSGQNDDVEVEVFVPINYDKNSQFKYGVNYQTKDPTKADNSAFSGSIYNQLDEDIPTMPDMLDAF